MRRAGAVTLVLLGLLALAPGAQASRGVYDAFGTPGDQGGQFFSVASGSRTSGAAVNTPGAGAADPGDVYVLDNGNRRVQQFDADGNFIRAFGQDVIVNVGTPPNSNGIGYEICDTTTVPANTAAECKEGIEGTSGGAMNITGTTGIPGIAIDQGTGDIYVSERLNRRVQQFGAQGNFIRTWGKDVVISGPEQADEQQRLTVDATAGQYKLSFGADTTADIAWNEAASGVEAKLNALASINGGGGNVAVSKGPGGLGGTTPYLISFGGALANTNLASIVVSAGTTPLNGGAGTAMIATLNDGAVGFEICGSAVNCQRAASESGGGSFNSLSLNGITVAPAGAPNEGHVLVLDGGNQRLQEFSATGTFVRSFGWDVVQSGPSDTGLTFEICSAVLLDICRAGAAGSGKGQFSQEIRSVAEDSTGNLYIVEESPNFRVQKFTLSGNVVTPQGAFDPAELTGTGGIGAEKGDTPKAVAVDTSTPPGTPGTVYVRKAFPKGFGSPPLAKAEERVLEVDPSANGGEGKVVATIGSLAGIGTLGNVANGLALNTASGRLYVPDANSPVFVLDQVPPLSIVPEATEADAVSATLHASITPSQIPLHTFYRFEYAKAGSGEWKRAPAEPAPDVDIGNGSSPVAVSQAIEGLRVGTAYEVRVLAYSKYRGTEALVQGDDFTTKATPPIVSTGDALWSSPAPTGPSLTLSGTINPGNDQTTYFFEYVSQEGFDSSGFASSKAIPTLPAPAGHGLTNVGVLQPIAGLDPAKTYVYRLVATNSVGTSVGNQRSIDPPDPNARFYELISNAESNGLGASLVAVSDEGTRAVLLAQTLGDPNSLPNQTSPFLLRRAPGGWEASQVNPNPESGHGGNAFSYLAWFPTDLSTALWSHYSLEEQVRGVAHWTFTDPDGSLRTALPTLVPVTGSGTAVTFFQLLGAAADLSSFVFQREEANPSSNGEHTSATYVPGQPLTTGEPGDIYRVSDAGGPSPTLALVNRDPAGNLISNACGAWVGARKVSTGAGTVLQGSNKGVNLRPVSSDGSVTYFSARPSGSTGCNEAIDRIRVFKRIGNSGTVEVSKSQCTRTAPTPCSSANGDDFFQAASANGNRVVFTSTRQLTSSDEDATADLYLYDSDPPLGQPALVQVSAGEVTANHAKAGSGAEVLEGVVDASVDGSRVYFVANGQLTAAATKGANNLFVYQRDAAHPAGRIAFVAKLDSGDSTLWGTSGPKAAYAMPFAIPGGGGPGDGHFLLFASKAKLLPADTDSVADLYRFDDLTSALLCLTCAGNGSFGIGVRAHNSFFDPASVQSSRIASEDLTRAVFTSSEQLSPEDHNAVSDVYEWHQGQLDLISSGDGDSSGTESWAMISADGAEVFFATADRILPSDNNSAADVYGARIGGGFPEAEQAVSCVSPDECRTPPVGTPVAPSPASSTFSGSGNQVAPSGAKCAKGKVKRKGHCVKKAKKKQKHRRKANERRAGNGRGGKR